MDLYGQNAEIRFLASVLPKLTRRSVIDVGAERGGFTESMLAAGANEVHAIEPERMNVEALRERFGRDSRVAIHETAIDAIDGTAELYLSSSPSGTPVSFGHTLTRRDGSTELVWADAITVTTRSLASLVAEGVIPARVGIVKIDTEGRDLAIVSGLGELECDVLMTEHWTDLPRSVGPCPWTADELLAEVSPRGFRHFACFVHREECTVVQWDDGRVQVGAAANLVFFHERVLANVLTDLLAAASELARETVDVAESLRETISVLDTERELQEHEAAARLEALNELERGSEEAAGRQLEKMAALDAERQRQTEEAAARLEMMATLEAERRRQTEEAAARLEIIEELDRRRSELEVLDADLADVIRSQRGELENALAGLTSASDDLSLREARALLEIALLQLRLVDERLLIPRAPRRFPRLRYEASRMRALTDPRLGRLRHYEPRPLQVPARYLSERAPGIAPWISIVTPSYQHRRFIERTILSVLEQGYPAIEYVVQDGASTDGTVEILERYSDRLASWRSEPDAGQADAINRGFGNTSGEIMGWLNSDDLLLPGALAYIGRYFAEHPEVDVVYGNRMLIDNDGNQIGSWVLPPHDDLALMLADFVPQETLFWRRRIWEASGGRLDPSLGYALDWDLLLRFQAAGARMVRLRRFLGAFRIHDEQKTSAAHPLGEVEMALLRERVFGRPVSISEVNQRLRPYLRRHVAHHVRQRLVDRLPLARVTVKTAKLPSTPADAKNGLHEPSPRKTSIRQTDT
jgi:FkbM family methyltransferase